VTGPTPEGVFEIDAVVIGGCGHVGLPLAIALASRGARVGIYDVSQAAVDTVNAGRLPFAEPGAAEPLREARAAGRLEASADPAIVATAEHVIVVIGTPVDEHLNPDQAAIPNALGGCAHFLSDGQILVLRSTVYPGVTALVEKTVAGLGVELDVAFCPERIAEGKAIPSCSNCRRSSRPGPRAVWSGPARCSAGSPGSLSS
jgi:UDP-N-acetyl-D-mannosaminuronic acid dehydrogenase